MKTDDITDIAVIGLGTMGPGMALEFARAGIRVAGFDLKPGAAEASRHVVDSILGTLVETGHVLADAVEKTRSRITYEDSLESAVSRAQVIVEAVSENRSVKQGVYQEVDRYAPGDSLIWSNTSTLNIHELVPESRLGQTIIAHWFAPPHIIPLIEVVKGEKTSNQTVSLTVELLKGLGKLPIVIERYVPGFIINRILRNLGREAFFLLDNGYISKEDLDLAVKASIAPRMMVLGLIQRYDFTGLDLSARNLLDESFFDPPVDNRPASLQGNIDKGHLGVKSGRGFYDYTGRELTDILKDRDRYLLEVMDRLQFCLEKDRLV